MGRASDGKGFCSVPPNNSIPAKLKYLLQDPQEPQMVNRGETKGYMYWKTNKQSHWKRGF